VSRPVQNYDQISLIPYAKFTQGSTAKKSVVEMRSRRKKLYSGVGTPDYLAPEILLGIGHSKHFTTSRIYGYRLLS
jgi:serine/threonine protein kinase